MNGSKRYALDSSVLLFHYFAGGTGIAARLIANSLLNPVTISETLYVICRLDGLEKATKFVEECARKSTLASAERIAPLAGQLKCKYPISLADCWALATARTFDVPCIFAFREAEILRNLEALRGEVEINFLDELQTN